MYSIKTRNSCGRLFEETNTCTEARDLILKSIEVSSLMLREVIFTSLFYFLFYFIFFFFMYSLLAEIFGVDTKNVCQFRSYVTPVPSVIINIYHGHGLLELKEAKHVLIQYS